MVALMMAGTSPVPRRDAELRQQPVADEGADNADDEIADEAEAGPAHDFAGEPAGDEADQQDDQKTFVRQMHG